MAHETLHGEEALALGALAAGVGLVTSYPGSPSSATVEAIVRRAARHGVYVEWSSNEKVALEMGIGASIAGRRALVALKSVGMNDAVDPLMSLNLTGVHGGLVILVGDDPGGYGSQNDQDTRPLVPFLELPVLEPAGSAEACAMIREAFAASERFRSAVVLRITLALAEDDKHGYAIMQEVAGRTGGEVRLGPGTLYRSIHTPTWSPSTFLTATTPRRRASPSTRRSPPVEVLRSE